MPGAGDAAAVSERTLAGEVLAGRTGDSDRMRSAWFVGTSKELSTAVTMFRTKPGAPQLLGMEGVGGAASLHGSVFPPEIWADYTRAAITQSLSDGL